MHGKVCLITGGNRGIGEATARALAEAGAEVVLACRDATAGASAARRINQLLQREAAAVLPVDLASLASIREAVERFAVDRLDVLINNAAIVSRRRQLSADGYELQFAVNHLAPFLLTNLLRPQLVACAPARVITVSSTAHYRGEVNLADLQSERNYGPYRTYRSTKLANVLFTRALSRRLEGTGVTANAVHPGVIATGLLGTLMRIPGPFVGMLRVIAGTPQRGAENVTFLATASELSGVTGEYFSNRQREDPSAMARDEELAEELWAESARLTGWQDVP